MFTKLLKHELKAQRGTMLTLSGAALGVGLLGGILAGIFVSTLSDTASTQASVIGEMLISFIIMGLVLTLFAYVVAVFIYQLYRFYRRHFTDEGYLTFTLPVTTHNLLLSTICSFIIWNLLSFLVLVLAINMIIAPFVYVALRDMDFSSLDFSLFFDSMSIALKESGLSIFTMILSAISSWVFSLILPLASLTIGCLAAKKHKILASFGIYYGITMAVSFIESILSVVVTMGDLIKEQVPSLDAITLITTCIQFAISIGGYFLMHHMMKKGLNLH